MVDVFHDTLGTFVGTKIRDKLRELQLRPDSPICKVAKSIESVGACQVHVTGGFKIPDHSLTYDWCDDQGEEVFSAPLVIEVSWSRPPEEIEEKAPMLIEQSQDSVQVRTVVHLDANKLYQSRLQAEQRIREETAGKTKRRGKVKGNGKAKEKDESVRFSVRRAVLQRVKGQDEITTDKLVYQVEIS